MTTSNVQAHVPGLIEGQGDEGNDAVFHTVLTSEQKDRIRTVFHRCNRNLYTNLDDIDHPDRLYYDGHLTVADLEAIVAALRQCVAEMEDGHGT